MSNWDNLPEEIQMRIIKMNRHPLAEILHCESKFYVTGEELIHCSPMPEPCLGCKQLGRTGSNLCDECQEDYTYWSYDMIAKPRYTDKYEEFVSQYLCNFYNYYASSDSSDDENDDD